MIKNEWDASWGAIGWEKGKKIAFFFSFFAWLVSLHTWLKRSKMIEKKWEKYSNWWKELSVISIIFNTLVAIDDNLTVPISKAQKHTSISGLFFHSSPFLHHLLHPLIFFDFFSWSWILTNLLTSTSEDVYPEETDFVF